MTEKTSYAKKAPEPEPFHAPNWITYTPTVGSGSGTITTASAVGRYVKFGTTIVIAVKVTITTTGTGAGYVTFTLPHANSSNDTMLSASNDDGVGVGWIAADAALGRIYDGVWAYPGANGMQLWATGVYETTVGGI
jgi:hypothetical protein